MGVDNLIHRVLIANRGAIAVRIIRTLKKMNIESLAIYAESDRKSLHVRYADIAISLGSGTTSETYLNQNAIIEIAKRYNAEAIHPGYGFLSENTDFVQDCENNGIIFLGPTAEQIKAFGLKHRARELAKENGVPLLPGSEILNNADHALKEAEYIGYPVMLKSTAGGGGIGMQLCYNPEQLSNAWDSVSTLSANNFSNSDLFLEKFLERARHIEVQVFGDGKGSAIAIGERDCSAQRRNQKVIEETPAPNLQTTTRKQLHHVAIDLVQSVNYRSAGTVEFIYDVDKESFYFLEVNTRLQVEHGVTEMVFGIDIVSWMIQLSQGQLQKLNSLQNQLKPDGHAIQARVYAEDPTKNFQPSAGLLSHVEFPETNLQHRIDHWIESGIEISPFYDPMLAKIIAHGKDRGSAIKELIHLLQKTSLYGLENNKDYLIFLLKQPEILNGACITSTLGGLSYQKAAINVLSGGTLTTIQDYPGRIGYWDIGIPPSGPFDNLSFRLGNQLLNNNRECAGLEMTVHGAKLQFSQDTVFVLAGADMNATLNDIAIPLYTVILGKTGQILSVNKTDSSGTRCYLLVAGGIQTPKYMGSQSTFTLGQFGGHAGRALRTGDVLHIDSKAQALAADCVGQSLPQQDSPSFTKTWEINVLPGPQGAPEFFTQNYLEKFYSSEWEVHFNSSRTGIRLIGPKPEWSRKDGGEAGMHPSNIHDNAYAIGTIDFTGDMPVILGPDGPSLGGFVCPATVISADLWKLGQLATGDKIKFVLADYESSIEQFNENESAIEELREIKRYESRTQKNLELPSFSINNHLITLNLSGDSYMLVSFGQHILDIELRFLVHRFMECLKKQNISGILELTPGIRTLQIHFDFIKIKINQLISNIENIVLELNESCEMSVPSRIVHLPLSWDDSACQLAIEKYHQTVRPNAPWHPSNIEFIRRINGLNSIEDLKNIVYTANYLVMGLGDVYLGAPVATPIDPRHRLVTTKYNPARTWTAENSVGIGGSYLCIYGMEGPGGYQFIGRTLQMWNRYRKTPEFKKPWLLRFFDQIKFYPVSENELQQIRQNFPLGEYSLKIEETTFNLSQYKDFINQNEVSISEFTQHRQKAYEKELSNWQASGQFNFEPTLAKPETQEEPIPEGMIVVESPLAGSIWQLNIDIGDKVEKDDLLIVLESMKMEFNVTSPESGTIKHIFKQQGAIIDAGSPLMIIEPDTTI